MNAVLDRACCDARRRDRIRAAVVRRRHRILVRDRPAQHPAPARAVRAHRARPDALDGDLLGRASRRATRSLQHHERHLRRSWATSTRSCRSRSNSRDTAFDDEQISPSACSTRADHRRLVADFNGDDDVDGVLPGLRFPAPVIERRRQRTEPQLIRRRRPRPERHERASRKTSCTHDGTAASTSPSCSEREALVNDLGGEAALGIVVGDRIDLWVDRSPAHVDGRRYRPGSLPHRLDAGRARRASSSTSIRRASSVQPCRTGAARASSRSRTRAACATASPHGRGRRRHRSTRCGTSRFRSIAIKRRPHRPRRRSSART